MFIGPSAIRGVDFVVLLPLSGQDKNGTEVYHLIGCTIVRKHSFKMLLKVFRIVLVKYNLTSGQSLEQIVWSP